MRIEDQIKSYARQIEATQHAVSADEALRRVDTIRIGGDPAPVAPTYSRWQKLAGVGAIAAVFLLLFGTTLWFTREVLPSEDLAVPSTVTPAAAFSGSPASEQRINTPIGTWVWTQLDIELGGVTELEGVFYSVESVRPFDEWGNPTDPEELDAPRHLLFSTDGVAWDQRTLPDEMAGLYLGVRERDGVLVMTGTQINSRSFQAWSSEDGITWTDLPGYPFLNPLGLSVPGITVSGATVQVRHGDPVQAGDLQLVDGSVSFRFPDVVNNVMEGAWGYESDMIEGEDIRYLIWRHDDEARSDRDRDHADVEVVVVMDQASDGGLVIDYTFWNGLESSGDLLHTARVEFDAALDVDPIDPENALHPWMQVLWRSEGTGGFEIVPIPVERAPLPYPHGQRIEHLTTVDGQFVLYGGAPGGPTTKVNEYVTRAEPSRIGVIATSSDGLVWESMLIEDLVNPQSVSVVEGMPTIWHGEFATWVSEDGLKGEVTERRSEDWITHGPSGAFMMINDSSIRISQDAETWFSIPLPGSSSQYGHSMHMTETRFFYSNGNSGFDWVGYLEP